jgi:tubulin polyglutamylase TTLL1
MPTRLKWKTDMEKNVVTLNFERRGWQCANNMGDDSLGGDWNFYWASVGSVRAIFGADSGIRLNDMQ